MAIVFRVVADLVKVNCDGGQVVICNPSAQVVISQCFQYEVAECIADGLVERGYASKAWIEVEG